MEPLGGDTARFIRLLLSFQCQKVPCDLLIRACESRPTWSSTGEIIDRLPLEAGVSEWLVDFYDGNKPFSHGIELGSYKGYINYTVEIDGIAYLEVTTGGQPDLEVIEERTLARERIAIILQAFPSINAEIIGEEIIERLMDVVKTSILPLLSSLTEADIEDWLLPEKPNEQVIQQRDCQLSFRLMCRDRRELFLISIVEFLYQVIDRFEIENPLIPLTLLRQLSSVISNEATNISIVLNIISQVLDAYDSNDALESNFWSSDIRVDQRSNALIGHNMAMQLSNKALLAQSKAPSEILAQALSNWRPLSLNNASTMEYLAATSLCSQSQLDTIENPPFSTVDTSALRGLLLSRSKRCKDAAKILNSSMEDITSRYGPTSMHLGIVTAELANCYNILQQENKAEDCLRKALQSRLERSLSTRRDGIYLRLALADSLIGQARYSEALPVLESIIDSPNISATFRMMSALRLAKSRRRMHEDPQRAFEQNSPLWAGLPLLRHVPDVLATEYVEELACNISEIPKVQPGNSMKPKELIEAVNSAKFRSSFLPDSPCWEWYKEVEQEYLGDITKAAEATKGKQRDDGSRKEDESEMRTSDPSRVSYEVHIPDEDFEGPWSERLVLSFGMNTGTFIQLGPKLTAIDGGGVRALSSLLILKRIMHRIMVLERTHPDGPAYLSRDSIWTTRDETGVPEAPEESDKLDGFVPCHYFDYVAGTSTGGLNSIMLGRLRMSINEAIDSFIHFGNSVFGQAQLLHDGPRDKYSAVRAGDAFRSIISNRSFYAGLDDMAINEGFTEYRIGTRTMALSLPNEEGVQDAHVWRSYDNPYGNQWRDRETHMAKIWEVAMATSATPGYFKPTEINGVTFLDGCLVANNPSYRALHDVLSIHGKAPVVFANIGTGSEGVVHRIETKWRDLPWRDRLRFQQGSIMEYTIDTDSETRKWLDLSERMGLEKAYRLSVEGDLRTIPYDDWRPANTGRKTFQKITDLTEEYLSNDKVRDIISNIAHEAVRVRRARAITERWKDFISDE
ncbi:hypothetical protein FGADI_11113 [Fusarium gaditjirri]|uniref:PNPLA domain-containing protein n=1 Tax=Fusarium gaditjirri TaxID=282569 RepID=A0A8H4WQT1_9HYPO|nr:hypothetical protein FGADI_11113 [Fusarium gaditjirri]